jgi:hypothetical protein
VQAFAEPAQRLRPTCSSFQRRRRCSISSTDGFSIRGCALQQQGTATAGSYGVYIAGNGSGISGATANTGKLTDVTVSGFYDDIHIDGVGGSVDFEGVSVWDAKRDGVYALSAQGYWHDVTSQRNIRNGFYIGVCALTPNCGSAPFISGIQSFNNGGWGLDVIGQALISGSMNYFNNDYAGEVRLNSSGEFANFTIENAGSTVNWGTNTTAVGLQVGASTSNLSITAGKVSNSQGIGMLVDASNVQFTAVKERASGLGNVVGNLYGAKFNSTSTMVNSQFFGPVLLTAASNAIFNGGNAFFGGTATVPSVQITGNSTNVNFADNKVFNLAGGIAFQCDAGSSLVPGDNVVSGTVTNNCSYGGSTVPNIPGRVMPLGATQASAGTISVPSQLFHVNGTATISTITPPTWLTTGCITIIADNTWAMSTAGNIRTAFTAVAGKQYTGCWDSSKWSF